MRILIVEDCPERIKWFNEKLKGNELHITLNPKEAIKLLEENEYEYIFLDHDLADEHYLYDTVGGEETGYHVADWLGLHPLNNKEAIIIIHSLNWNGVKRMKDALTYGGRDAIVCEFTTLQKRMIV